jgi:hypothetical protein
MKELSIRDEGIQPKVWQRFGESWSELRPPHRGNPHTYQRLDTRIRLYFGSQLTANVRELLGAK